jgi:hypothetical protein
MYLGVEINFHAFLTSALEEVCDKLHDLAVLLLGQEPQVSIG